MLTPYQIYKKKRRKKILFEIFFWFLVISFLVISIIQLFVVDHTSKEWRLFLKITRIFQTIIIVLQFPLLLLKFRSIGKFLITRYKSEKKNKEEWKEVIVKKNKGIIDEVALSIKTKEASKSEVKRFKHNEQIAIALKSNCGEMLRGTPYYAIKEVMNSNVDKKERIQKIVDILKQNNIELTKNIRILLKNIA